MIVNYFPEGWEIVTQRAHGMLAAEIGYYWKKKHRPGRWMETLLAIAGHDDAENELDGENLLTATGGPLNYAMKNFELAHCEKLERMTITKSRYIQLLSSMHLEFLYGKEAGADATAKRFLAGQKKLRTSLASSLGIAKSELKRTYDFMEWCDAFSLILCENQIQPEKRMIEISTGPDQAAYQVFKTGFDTISVKPWPFEVNAFAVQFERRIINQLTFSDSAEFRRAFLQSPVAETRWTIRSAPKGFRSPDKLAR